MELLPAPPPPPEEVQLDFRVIGRRWKEPSEVAERRLVEGGVPLVEIPQPPRKGVTLADLLAFEERWRKAEKERLARWEAERVELRTREEERDHRQAEARVKMELRKAEADQLMEAASR